MGSLFIFSKQVINCSNTIIFPLPQKSFHLSGINMFIVQRTEKNGNTKQANNIFRILGREKMTKKHPPLHSENLINNLSAHPPKFDYFSLIKNSRLLTKAIG